LDREGGGGAEDVPAANWIKSATPTSFSSARSPRFPHKRARPVFSLLEHSSARMSEPSQAPLKQSWNAALIAARAASVHSPSARNCCVSVSEISLHTAGQAAASCGPKPINPFAKVEKSEPLTSDAFVVIWENREAWVVPAAARMVTKDAEKYIIQNEAKRMSRRCSASETKDKRLEVQSECLP
jgi:hypothetical protein